MAKHLNIVAFDNPYPPNYGGVIDVFYKIKELAKQGVKIHLHYFSNKRCDLSILNEICEEVYIYKRKLGIKQLFSTLPYIVETRKDQTLKSNLDKNNYPILFEGLHTTKLLFEDKSTCNRSIIRHHNIEHNYYRGLYKSEKNILHRLYYLLESLKLKSYLQKVKDVAYHLTISDADASVLTSLSFKNIITIPPFHSFDNESQKHFIQEGLPYVLYHGNLTVAENIAAANYLIDHVFTDTCTKYIIAGSIKGNYLKKKSTSNIEIIDNPTKEEITNLIANARVIALPTFQPTGVKLKLIDSLYMGQHVIVNGFMIEGFPIQELALLAKNTEDMRLLISECLLKPFTSEDKQRRIQKLNKSFNNSINAERIISVIEKLSS